MRKIVNLIKLFISYLLSVLIRKPVIWGKPAFVSIEPTNHCNLRCPECPTGQLGLTRAKGHLKPEDFSHFIDELSPDLAYLTLYFQGEPYLNTDLFNLISIARARKIYVWTSTNGHYFTEKNIHRTIQSGLNKLIISIDGTDQESYEQYRVGGSYQKVIEGTRDFVRIRKELNAKRPLLEVQFLVLKSNEHQVKEIKKLGKLLGVDKVVLKTAQFYDFEQGNPLMPEMEKWSRYKPAIRTSTVGAGHAQPVQESRDKPAKYKIKNPLPDRCFRMWSGCVVTWDGKVVPCCFDKDADHCLGDLKSQSFNDIWEGEPYRLFRKQIFENRKSVDICRNCSQWV